MGTLYCYGPIIGHSGHAIDFRTMTHESSHFHVLNGEKWLGGGAEEFCSGAGADHGHSQKESPLSQGDHDVEWPTKFPQFSVVTSQLQQEDSSGIFEAA